MNPQQRYKKYLKVSRLWAEKNCHRLKKHQEVPSLVRSDIFFRQNLENDNYENNNLKRAKNQYL